MIIDVHTHIGHTLLDQPDAWGLGIGKYRWLRSTKGRPWESKLSNFFPLLEGVDTSDPGGEKSYKEIKEAGIDKCVLLPMDFNLIGLNRYRMKAEYLPKRKIEEINKHIIVDVAGKFSDKYIPFFGIDPRRGREGLYMLKKAVEEWGAKGVKLHPTAGYYPNDRKVCYPLYEVCLDLDLPVLCHCGPESGDSLTKYADPIHWEEIASDFPDLRVCLAHAGGGLSTLPGRQFLDAVLAILVMYENVYTDIAGAQMLYVRDPVKFYQEVKRLLDWAAGKVLFGTDCPWMGVVGGLGWKGYADAFRNPNSETLDKAGVSFAQKDVDGLLGENAKHWLKLETT